MTVRTNPVDQQDRPHVPDTPKSGGRSRTEDLTARLVDEIISGAFAAGSTIPTEAQIGETYGVSRTVVREAVKVLAEKQLVRIDRGRGTVVLPRHQWRMLDAANLSARIRHGDREVVIHELFVMRKGIEPELAAMAAACGTPEAIASIGARVEALVRSVGSESDYRAADGHFHEAIAEAAGVAIAIEFLRVMREPLDLSRQLTDLIPEGIASAHRHHLEIFAAIGERDPEAARAAMRRHLEWAEERLGLALEPGILPCAQPT